MAPAMAVAVEKGAGLAPVPVVRREERKVIVDY